MFCSVIGCFHIKIHILKKTKSRNQYLRYQHSLKVHTKRKRAPVIRCFKLGNKAVGIERLLERIIKQVYLPFRMGFLAIKPRHLLTFSTVPLNSSRAQLKKKAVSHTVVAAVSLKGRRYKSYTCSLGTI